MNKILWMISCICIAYGVSGQGFSGTFSGVFNEIPTTLIFQQSGDTVKGEMEAEGYIYTLQATASGQTAKGKLTDPQLGGVMDFTANVSTNTLTLTLIIPDPATGELHQVPIQFQRGTSPPQTRQKSNPSPEKGIDPQLVGTWVKNESMTSGDFTMAIETVMELRADGTLRVGDSRVVGGGATSSFDTGPSDEAFVGKWRTSNKIISVLASGAKEWREMARYYVENGKLLTTAADGTKELWYKR